ncbi:MAG TPA: hypothetical protein VF270_07230, partial [Ignavibacteriaceae bacterium]
MEIEMKIYLRNILLIVFVTFAFFFPAFGKHIGQLNAIRTVAGSGTPVIVNTPTAVDSIKITAPSLNQRDYSITDNVSLGVDLHYPEFVLGPQHVRVLVTVIKYDESYTSPDSAKVYLNIDYFHHDTINSKILDKYQFNNVYKIIFRIDSVFIDNVYSDTLPKNLFVKAQIQGQRYNKLAPESTINGLNINFLDLDNNSKPDEIEMSWNVNDDAEEYQLEFFHISNYGNNGTIPPDKLSYDFRYNSTIITTSKHFYQIPLIFNQGWVAFRVRPIGVDFDNPSHIVYGKWSTLNNTGTIDQLQVSGGSCKINITAANVQDNKLNWQYNATYAEQGKRKDIVTYYDGTLRDRQKVTRINSDNRAIVGETIYDYAGRKAIIVLPSPVVIDSTN